VYKNSLTLVKMAAAVMAVLSSSLIYSTKLPEITVDGWRSNSERNWNTTTKPPLSPTSNETMFVVPSIIGGMSILCNASYPIEWYFHRERWGRQATWTTMISHIRSSDPSNLNPIWYSSELRFAGGNVEITGNYTCQRYGQPEVSSSVYIYWEGETV
jgi:hypothetical protein